MFFLFFLFFSFMLSCEQILDKPQNKDDTKQAVSALVDMKADFTTVVTGNLLAPPIFTIDGKIIILTNDGMIREIAKNGQIKKALRIDGSFDNNFFLHPTNSIYLTTASGFMRIYTTNLELITSFVFPYKGKIIPLETGNLFLYNSYGFKIFTNTGEKISETDFKSKPKSIARQFGLIAISFENQIICYNEFGEIVWRYKTKEYINSIIKIKEGFLLNSQDRNIILNFKGKQILQERYLINSKIDKKYRGSIPRFAFSDGSMVYEYKDAFLYFDKNYNLKIKLKSLFHSNFTYFDITEDGYLFLGDANWILYGKQIIKDKSIKAYPYISFGTKFLGKNKRFLNGENVFSISNYSKSFGFLFYNGLLEKRDRDSVSKALSSIQETIRKKEIGGKLQMYEYFLYRIASDVFSRTMKEPSGRIANDFPTLRIEALKTFNKIGSFSSKYKFMYLTNLEKDEDVLIEYIRIISSLLVDTNGNISSWLYKIISHHIDSKVLSYEIIKSVYLVSKYSYKIRLKDLLIVIDFILKKTKYPTVKKFASSVRRKMTNNIFEEDEQDINKDLDKIKNN